MKKILKIISITLAVVIMMTSAFSLAACKNESAYQAGGFKIGDVYSPQPRFGVKAKSNTFEKSNVSLDLHLGIYSKSFELTDLFGTSTSVGKYCGNESHYYVFAACKPVDWYQIETDAECSNLDDFYVLSKIQCISLSQENDYGYHRGGLAELFGVVYNHCEQIIIPEELISGTSGEFIIASFDLRKSTENDDGYVLSFESRYDYIRIPYTVDENNIVTLHPEIKDVWRE